jgi:hypothetical protein
VGKFTTAESILIKSIVASLTIKRIPEAEIISEIHIQALSKLIDSQEQKINDQTCRLDAVTLRKN